MISKKVDILQEVRRRRSDYSHEEKWSLHGTNVRVKQETRKKNHQNTSKKVENTYKIT